MRKTWKLRLVFSGKRAVLIVLLAVLCGASCGKKESGSELTEITEDTFSESADKPEEALEYDSSEAIGEDYKDAAVENNAYIYVHVCGAVKSPGVYRLREGSRLYEAVEAAGGLTEDASGESLNQAAIAEDGQQIYILSKEETAANPGNSGGAQTAEEDDGKININTANKEQLMTLSGIGETKADSIIQYREEHGGFQNIEEIMEIDGIKEGVFQKISDQIKL